MSRDIYDKVKEYNGAVKARFCMPGHSGVDSLDALYSSAAYDWTEVNGLDNLLYSDGVIANCEKKLAKNYGYENSLMAHIRRIREKIEANPSQPVSLITMKGLGYKLVVEGK